MAVFTGAGVAIATPFDENYNIDYESFGKFIDFQVENKTDAIIVWNLRRGIYFKS